MSSRVNLYTVYDLVSRLSSSPFTAASHYDAYKQHVTSFQLSLERNKNLNFDDFELHYIGSYNPKYVLESDSKILDDSLIGAMGDKFSGTIQLYEANANIDGYITIDSDYLSAIDSSNSNDDFESLSGPFSRKQIISKESNKG